MSLIQKLIFIIFILFAGFLVSNTANAQVRVDNFNVIQKTIPSILSNVDFRLTISQQEQSLDCSNLPFTNGNLEWVVWHEFSGGASVVRRESVSLPLSPNPRNLDFQVTGFQPSQMGIQSGKINFRAALSCSTSIINMSQNLAVSSPIQVTIVGGGQVPPGGGQVPPGGGQVPGQPQTVPFEIKNPIAAKSLVDLAKAIGKFLFQIAIPIAVIIIIYAGLLFLTSGGNQEKVKKARTALLYAIIGLAIILIGQGFFTLIKSILNLGTP